MTKPRDYAHTLAVLKTSQGDITVKFYYDKAPGHVKNFIDLSAKGFYDGTLFHRVIPGFMVQGGDPLTKDPANAAVYGTGGNKDAQGNPVNLKAEFNDVSHRRGVLSMARASDPNSASSQFFLVVKDSPFLDRQYTAFGEVVKGLEVADKIVAESNTDPASGGRGVPRSYQKIVKVELIDEPPRRPPPRTDPFVTPPPVAPAVGARRSRAPRGSRGALPPARGGRRAPRRRRRRPPLLPADLAGARERPRRPLSGARVRQPGELGGDRHGPRGRGAARPRAPGRRRRPRRRPHRGSRRPRPRRRPRGGAPRGPGAPRRRGRGAARGASGRSRPPPRAATRRSTPAFFFRELATRACWALEKGGASPLSPTHAAEWDALAGALARDAADPAATGDPVPTHRDYHANNLMRASDGRLALIDFQDLRLGPPDYDPVSLRFERAGETVRSDPASYCGGRPAPEGLEGARHVREDAHAGAGRSTVPIATPRSASSGRDDPGRTAWAPLLRFLPPAARGV